MSEVIEFILKYKNLFILGISFLLWLISFIVMCCKKRPKNIYELSSIAFEIIPKLVKSAEMAFGPGTGTEKLNFVLESFYDFVCENSSLSRDEVVARFGKKATEMIEDILTCPVKKGN